MTLPWKRTNSNLTTRLSRFDSPIQQLFDDFLTDLSIPVFDRSLVNFTPKINVIENEDSYKVTAELPGVSEDDIDVSLDDNILRIRGEKKEERSDTRFSRYESTYGSFERAIQLPSDVDIDNVQANCKNGILEITLGKSETSTRSRKIQIGMHGNGKQIKSERTEKEKERH